MKDVLLVGVALLAAYFLTKKTSVTAVSGVGDVIRYYPTTPSEWIGSGAGAYQIIGRGVGV